VEEDTYMTGQVARILMVTDRGVRKMIDRGELEAYQDERDPPAYIREAKAWQASNTTRSAWRTSTANQR
jgi:hypothetical protein